MAIMLDDDGGRRRPGPGWPVAPCAECDREVPLSIAVRSGDKWLCPECATLLPFEWWDWALVLVLTAAVGAVIVIKVAEEFGR